MYKSDISLKVYETLCQKFIENISDEKQESFRLAYLAFLHKQYDEFFGNTPEEDERVAICCTDTEELLRLPMTEMDKQALLFPDEAYLELENVCMDLIGAANQKQNGEDVEMSASYDEYYREMQEKFSKVSELFRFTAERMLSEGLLALDYIFKESSDTGFRMHNFDE